MLIFICGHSGVGKSVALEILEQNNFKTFNTDKWIHQMYKFGEPAYIKIKNKLGDEFVNSKEVDRIKLRSWVEKGFDLNNTFSQNPNLIALNNITLPMIKNKLVELSNQDELIFVELAIFIKNYPFFSDINYKVIYIKRDNAPKFEKNRIESVLEIEPKNDWYIVDNSSSIEHFTNELLNATNNIIEEVNKKLKLY